jgi:long-chain fatty acid transport protein
MAQNGVTQDSIGATAAGRGRTNLAHSDNGDIVLDNPAGMANLDSCGLLEFGVAGLITDIHYADPLNSTTSKIRPEALPDISYIQKSADGRWAFGLGLFAPAGFGAEYEIYNRVFGRQQYESFGALGKILPALAYKVTDRLSIGGSFGVGLSTVQLEGPFHLQTGPAAGAPVLMHLHATDAAPVWSVGMQYQLSERTTLGAAYTEESRFNLDGKLDASVAGLGPAPVYSRFDSQVNIVWPRSVGVGLTHILSERQRLSMDVSWFDWSDAFDNIGLRLTNASNPLFTALLGPTIRDEFPLHWRDTVSARFGYEFLLTPCDVLRAGYMYDSPAVPSATLSPYIPGILQHTFTLGYGREWDNWRFNLAYQYAFSPKERVSQSGIVGGDFNNSELRAQVHWLFLSVSYRF